MKNYFKLRRKLVFTLMTFSLSLLCSCTDTELSTVELMKVSEDGNPNRLFEHKGTVYYENNYTREKYTDGLTYTTAVDSEGNNICSVSAGTITSGYVYIPDYYVDDAGVQYTITSLAKNAFNSVNIDYISKWPANLSVVRKQSFANCIKISSFSFPAGPTQIFPGTFENCKMLTYFLFDDGSLITKICDHAFSGNDYLNKTFDNQNFKLPNGLIEISESAFAYCTFLNDIVIPSTVTTIRENAFYQCTKVVYIFIPNISAVTIEKYAFRGIPNAQIYLQADALPATYTDDWNRIGNKSGSSTDSSVYIQYVLGIESIGTESDFIFVQNNYFYITQYIGDSTNVSVPLTLGGHNVRSIKEEAFYYNNAITSIDMHLATSLISIEKKAIQNCDALTTIVFPSSLEAIGDDAFYDSNNITSLLIPKSVKTIGSNAFINAYNVTSLIFKVASDNTSSLTSIRSGAFQNCGKNITPAIPVELIIPSSLMDTSTTTYNQRIGNNSFNTCKLFTTLTFKDNPNTTFAASSRTSINENAFINCANLSVIN